MIGQRVGPYEVLAKIGEGGMGEVYRARDTRLDRDVALKILPAAFATDHDRSARFEREAKMLAALNHPHIAQIYGLEDAPAAAGSRALAMELVSGATLAERLAHGALPLGDCVAIARQIVDALDAAHEAGIVHRDLKPANIKVRDDGTVKVLDFGLAKTATPTESQTLATFTSPAVTAAGVILGTAAYMSPEQARGRPVDKRTDIWAFGCVLYEMLTGGAPFTGETVTDVIAAVVKNEPDLPALVAPARIKTLLSRCLQKDPRQRLRDIGDAKLELAEPFIADTTVRVAPARQRVGLLAAAGAILLAIGVVAGALWNSNRATGAAVFEWTGARIGGPAIALNPRVSPDGQLVAFITTVDRQSQVAVMKPDTGNWTVLTRDRSKGLAYDLSWAPDGSRLYYNRTDGVYSVPALGGEERFVLENAIAPEALSDGTLIVRRINANRQPQIHRFTPSTGRLEALPAVLQYFGEDTHHRAMPGGRSVAFLGRPESDESQPPGLYTLDLETKETRHLGASLPISLSSAGLAPSLTVDPDDSSIVLSLRDGTLTRLFRVASNGNVAALPLLFPTRAIIDAARGGSLFVSLNSRPVEVLGVASDGRVERRAWGPSIVNTGIAPLPGGRFLVAATAGNRLRILVASPGKEPVPLVETDESTLPPMTPVGDAHVALLIESGNTRDIAVVAADNGRIVDRFRAPSGITSLAASPDGKILYLAAGGVVSAMPRGGGTPRTIGAGDSIVVDPDTGDVIAKLNEQGGSRLVRLPSAGGPPHHIPVKGEFGMIPNPLMPGAIRDNQLVLPLLAADSWDYHAGRINLASGQISRLPMDYVTDVHFITYGTDGAAVAMGSLNESTLWRFERRTPATIPP